ncbi:hypothetical protein AYO44_12670 [Planctomycetaceae bacterium SCGC AG-212-F19]|nr:hypothetical protein AYO44_12670 [Planctomycetaceae bacterium SCGC AG-212-F19]
MTKRVCWWVMAGVVLVAGCQARLNVENSYPAMQPGETKFILVGAPISEQMINVTVSSGGVPINVHVVPGTTSEQAEKAIKDKQGILGSKMNTADPTVDATIPAKQAFVVAVETPDKPANVKVKITSR